MQVLILPEIKQYTTCLGKCVCIACLLLDNKNSWFLPLSGNKFMIRLVRFIIKSILNTAIYHSQFTLKIHLPLIGCITLITGHHENLIYTKYILVVFCHFTMIFCLAPFPFLNLLLLAPSVSKFRS